ncbi:3-phosphoshikimate 1-carboxyvinyltransferase [Actinomycetaceae bacterium TAE3-ERU4]|nr:3-phosphoshikimate 1-carboxyvinyltransferase [Actinomycetaceae bacterium TAE3-ERU4]
MPGSKSLTARYLILAAQATAPSTLSGALLARDTELMLEALKRLGVRFAITPEDSPKITVFPTDFSFPPSLSNISFECGLAGTVMRFLPPLCLLRAKTSTFRGDYGALKRPIFPLLNFLESLGAEYKLFSQSQEKKENKESYDLFSLTAPAMINSVSPHSLEAKDSSQFISSLLLSASSFPNGLTFRVNKDFPSATHVFMTLECARDFGAEIDITYHDRYTEFSVSPLPLKGRDIQIEPDLSNAGPFICAPLIAGGKVEINHWPTTTTQAGDYWRDILNTLGAQCELIGSKLKIHSSKTIQKDTRELVFDLSAHGELTPTLAALAALRPGVTTIEGIGHLRHHETNRLTAIATEITKLGGKVEQLENGLRFLAPIKKPGIVDTYEDHRMATFGALLGLGIKGIKVRNIETTQKTLPGFKSLWNRLLERKY